MGKGSNPGRGRTLSGEPAPVTRAQGNARSASEPPCSRSEVRAREVMGHGERETSHAPGHGQPRRRRVEQATPRRERLEMPDTEHMAQVHVEDEFRPRFAAFSTSYLAESLWSLRGSVGRNRSEANGFALMCTRSLESMGVGESACCILALWNILRWRSLSSSENQGHGAPNGSHTTTLQAQTSCSVG